MKFYNNPSTKGSFKQIQLISMLRSQVGEETFLKIKKSLRLKREVMELSRTSCSRLIEHLIKYQKNNKNKLVFKVPSPPPSEPDLDQLSNPNITIEQALTSFIKKLNEDSN